MGELMAGDQGSIFSEINAIVGFASGIIGLITGSGVAFATLRKLYNQRTANYLDQIDNLEKLLKSKEKRIKILEASYAGLAQTALTKHNLNVEQQNFAQAIACLEEWFEEQRADIGQIAQHLAEHYVSYSESEILRSALARAERAATLAALCLDNPKEISDLLNEIRLVAAEFPAERMDEHYERVLDVVEDFAGAPYTVETNYLVTESSPI